MPIVRPLNIVGTADSSVSSYMYLCLYMYIVIYDMYTLFLCVCVLCMSKLQRHRRLAEIKEKNNYHYVRN
jgi:hypothetical protein